MDEATISPVQAIGDFAREEYTGNANTTSRFYLNSNLCFLNATSLGKRAINQTDAEKGSILGSGVTNMADRVASLVGLLGSPSALTPETATLALAQMLPASPRGSLVVHSAGSNGIYLGKGERGAKQSTDGTLHFGLNFRTGAGQFHMDSNNKPTSVDLRDGFDDIIMAGGN
jgi:hypothetical protein